MNPQVTTYIDAQTEEWQRHICEELRAIVHRADPEIVEEIKWGAPYFMHAGAVCWMFCAQEWVHFSFPQGALLDHRHGLFEETDAKVARTMRFRQGASVPERVIAELVTQAVANNEAGERIDFQIPRLGTREFDLPAQYREVLHSHGLLDEYEQRPYYQRKGWIEWIEQAKRPATRDKRIRAMIQELGDGTYMPPKGAR